MFSLVGCQLLFQMLLTFDVKSIIEKYQDDKMKLSAKAEKEFNQRLNLDLNKKKLGLENKNKNIKLEK